MSPTEPKDTLAPLPPSDKPNNADKVQEVLEKVDEPVRTEIRAIIQSRTQSIHRPPGLMEAVSSNLNPEHVHEIIKLDAAGEKRAHEERGYVRRYTALPSL